MSEAPASPDAVAMARLAKALSFIRGPQDPTTLAVEKAAASGQPDDIRKARALFSKLKPGDRAAALAMIAE
jgi:hypothetical protein